jgi:hypothetical protein
MANDPPRRLITTLELERRVRALEADHDRLNGTLARELGVLRQEMADANRARTEMSSQADFSWRPDGGKRMSLRNLPAWTILGIVLAVCITVILTTRSCH